MNADEVDRRIAEAKRISEKKGESSLQARRRVLAAMRPDNDEPDDALVREQEQMVQAAERETW